MIAANDVACDRPSIAFLPWADRFEDHHDTIGITLDDFSDVMTGTWLFNYIEALQASGVRPVMYFVSARVPGIVRTVHRPTGAPVRFLPAPWVHRKLQGAGDRLGIDSPLFASVRSYVATPWRSLAAELRRDRCGAILCHEYEYPRFDEAVALGRALRIPVFATFQGASGPRSAIERPFRRAAIRRAAGLVIGARRELQRVRAVYGVAAERTALVPNAMDVRRWQPLDRAAARSALDIPLAAGVVVWHGRVQVECKGLDVLLDAWQQLHTERPSGNHLLVLVGSGRDDEALRRRLATLPPGIVRWEDRYVLDRTRLWQYLSAADVATLPSRHEGFPIAVIEAMACGLPVVASDVSGVADAFGTPPAGVVVPPEDAPALAAALHTLLEDDALRRDLGARARSRAESEFSVEAVGHRLRGFMQERGAFQPASARNP